MNEDVLIVDELNERNLFIIGIEFN